MSEKRKKIWIDRLQTTLSIRIALYFVIYQGTVWPLIYLGRAITRSTASLMGETAAAYYWVFLVTVVLVLGYLFILDSIKMTHRLVGPLYRFRKTIQAITAGEGPELVQLRNGDYLQEMKDELNAMLNALEQRGAIAIKRPDGRPGPIRLRPASGPSFPPPPSDGIRAGNVSR
jgi:hypothetical protein